MLLPINKNLSTREKKENNNRKSFEHQFWAIMSTSLKFDDREKRFNSQVNGSKCGYRSAFCTPLNSPIRRDMHDAAFDHVFMCKTSFRCFRLSIFSPPFVCFPLLLIVVIFFCRPICLYTCIDWVNYTVFRFEGFFLVSVSSEIKTFAAFVHFGHRT